MEGGHITFHHGLWLPMSPQQVVWVRWLPYSGQSNVRWGDTLDGG